MPVNAPLSTFPPFIERYHVQSPFLPASTHPRQDLRGPRRAFLFRCMLNLDMFRSLNDFIHTRGTIISSSFSNTLRISWSNSFSADAVNRPFDRIRPNVESLSHCAPLAASRRDAIGKMLPNFSYRASKRLRASGPNATRILMSIASSIRRVPILRETQTE